MSIRALLIAVVVFGGCARAGFDGHEDGSDASDGDASAADGTIAAECDPACAEDESCVDRLCTKLVFISPEGIDDPLGGTESSPWKTFGFAIPRLEPGQTLILLDGDYTPDTTGFPIVDCGPTGNARNGFADKPVALRAKNERRAFLKTEGRAHAVDLYNCAHWVVDGIVGFGADLSAANGGRDGDVMIFRHSQNLVLRHLLAAYPNRFLDDAAILVHDSADVLLEESEVYTYHRYGILVDGGERVTVRRCYANSRNRADVTGGLGTWNQSRGDTGISGWNAMRHSIFENCISEKNERDFETGANPNDGIPQQFLGCIVVDNSVGFEERAPGSNVTFRDIVVIRNVYYAMRFEGITNARVSNATLFAGGEGVVFDPKAEAESVFLTNVLILNSSGAALNFPIGDQPEWLVEYCNAFNNGTNFVLTELIDDDVGHIRLSQSTAPTGVGLGPDQCIVYVPATSNMKGAGKDGADIGANIVYRYEDGVLTTEKLWDQATGHFPCGAVVPGLNDMDDSCITVHERLNVGANGCPVP